MLRICCELPMRHGTRQKKKPPNRGQTNRKNMTTLIVQIIILILLLALSFFFSSAETSLTTVNRIRVMTIAEDDESDLQDEAQALLKVLKDPSKMLTAILIGNNIVNLSASSLATTVAIGLVGSVGAGIATGILTFLILIFGEITPKNLATIRAFPLAIRYAKPVWALMVVLTPFIFFFRKISEWVLRLFGVKPDEKPGAVTEDEIKTIVDVGHKSGTIEEDEKDYIHNIFDFSESEAKEIMIPRIDMTAVNANWSYDKLMDVFEEHMYTRYPVYEGDIDHIIGVINMKDLLTIDRSKPFSIRRCLREPYFTFDHKSCAELFEEMRTNSISMAIVKDEYGAVAGMITLEDLLEELVGEIRDEYDTYEEDDIVQTGENEYDVLGTTNLEDLCDELNLNFTSEDYDTIGGYLTGLFDHFPETGETYVTKEGILLRVKETGRKRVTKVSIRLPEGWEDMKESPTDTDSHS